MAFEITLEKSNFFYRLANLVLGWICIYQNLVSRQKPLPVVDQSLGRQMHVSSSDLEAVHHLQLLLMYSFYQYCLARLEGFGYDICRLCQPTS